MAGWRVLGGGSAKAGQWATSAASHSEGWRYVVLRVKFETTAYIYINVHPVSAV
jgi:hypothetical protein